jgi:hypothetical protein
MSDPRGPEFGPAGERPGYVAPPPYAKPFDATPPQSYGYPYGPPPGYPPYTLPPGYVAVPAYYPVPAPAPPLAFGVVAAALAAAGAVLVMISLLGLPWFSGGSNGDLTTGDIRVVLDNYGQAANGFSVAYFSWLAWVLLIVSAGCAVAAALPIRGVSLAFRIAGPIVAGFALLLSFSAIELTSSLYSTSGTYSGYFDQLTVGFWTAVVGFALVGAGGIVGPRAVRTPPA